VALFVMFSVDIADIYWGRYMIYRSTMYGWMTKFEISQQDEQSLVYFTLLSDQSINLNFVSIQNVF